MAADRKSLAGDVSGDHGASAVRAAGALQDEFAPTLLGFVRSAVRRTRQRPLELAALCGLGLAGRRAG